MPRIVIACASFLAVAVLLTSSAAAQQLTASEPADTPERTLQIVDRSLNWLARHQNPDGGWGLASYPHQCKDPSCQVGLPKRGNQNASDVAGTAMAVSPFLAAGHTHKTKSLHQKTVYAGLYWLLKTQKSDGDLRGAYHMREHAIATIALCDAYGQSGDRQVGAAAQPAINFIQKAQCEADGGWNPVPKQPGETSTTGWQIVALACATKAGLTVDPQVVVNAKKWFLKVAAPDGYYGETQPDKDPAATAIGNLCARILGLNKEPTTATKSLMTTLPTKSPDCHHWFFCAHLARTLDMPEAAKWRIQLQSVLGASQATEQCASGSWNPTKDPHAGGRVMATGLNTMALLLAQDSQELTIDRPSKESSK